MALSGCATIGPPRPPSLDLPKPPSDLHATRKGDRVLLTWTIPTLTTDRQRIGTLGLAHICRAVDPLLSSCSTPAGVAVPPQNLAELRRSPVQKVTATYNDTLPTQLVHDNPEGFVTYAVEVFNTDGRGAGLSNQVRVPLAPTLPPPHDFSARVTGQGVLLVWNASPTPATQAALRYVFRIYRQQQSGQAILVGEVAATNAPNYSFSDPSIEWEQTYDYRADTVTVVEPAGRPEVRIEGDDTPAVEVFTHDSFPPAVPSGLQAVFSGPGQQPFIDLIWAPVADLDLAGYNVYRHEEGKPPEKVNAEPVKTPSYRDSSVVAGKNYSYSVSAVDVRGNESLQSEEATETVP